jgi:hypothetical protein
MIHSLTYAADRRSGSIALFTSKYRQTCLIRKPQNRQGIWNTNLKDGLAVLLVHHARLRSATGNLALLFSWMVLDMAKWHGV